MSLLSLIPGVSQAKAIAVGVVLVAGLAGYGVIKIQASKIDALESQLATARAQIAELRGAVQTAEAATQRCLGQRETDNAAIGRANSLIREARQRSTDDWRRICDAATTGQNPLDALFGTDPDGVPEPATGGGPADRDSTSGDAAPGRPDGRGGVPGPAPAPNPAPR